MIRQILTKGSNRVGESPYAITRLRVPYRITISAPIIPRRHQSNRPSIFRRRGLKAWQKVPRVTFDQAANFLDLLVLFVERIAARLFHLLGVAWCWCIVAFDGLVGSMKVSWIVGGEAPPSLVDLSRIHVRMMLLLATLPHRTHLFIGRLN